MLAVDDTLHFRAAAREGDDADRDRRDEKAARSTESGNNSLLTIRN